MSYYTIIVPLSFHDNLFAIADPFSFPVWICFLISIPAYIGAKVLLDYLFSGYTNWESATGAVIRGALSEHTSTDVIPKHIYQKLLVFVWSLMMVIIISAYKGDLIAIITKPVMDFPFTNAEEMASQSKMKWEFTQGGLFPNYAKNRPAGTPLREIFDQANASSTFSYCQSIVKKSGNLAAVCDIASATSVVASDFSKTGTCNYYFTHDKILVSDSALAFPASSL